VGGLSLSRGRRPLASLALLWSLAACTTPAASRVEEFAEAAGGNERVALEIVRAWFGDMAGDSEDRGWSLLYPTVRTEVVRSEADYRRTVASADWAGFRPSIAWVRLTDGEYRVAIEIPGGQKAIPEFLVRWGLIYLAPEGGGTDNELGIVTVRIDPSGAPVGVQSLGYAGP
jgi:hypothetical protein